MKNVEMKENYKIDFEIIERSIRFVIYFNGCEIACRKEKINVIQEFLEKDYAPIFKGRIKLIKFWEEIIITYKGEIIGKTSKKFLSNVLNKNHQNIPN